MNNYELPMNPEPNPPVVARVRVMGKDWQLLYMSLPVGTHDLYARQFSYRAPSQDENLVMFTREEIQKHEKYCEDLRYQIRNLEAELRQSRQQSPVATIYRDPYTGNQEIEFSTMIPPGELVRVYAAPNPTHADLLNVAVEVRDACHNAWVTSNENWRSDVNVGEIIGKYLKGEK